MTGRRLPDAGKRHSGSRGSASPAADVVRDRDGETARAPADSHYATAAVPPHLVPRHEKTEVYRPGRPAPGGDAAAAGRRDAMDDPPVGWLVVVDGPGRGRVATLGMGINVIGGDRTVRMARPQDCGDLTVSRTDVGAISYYPGGRKFHVAPGLAEKRIHIDGEPLSAVREIAPSTEIQVGRTVLRFVALCGEEFCWDGEGDRRTE